MGGALQPLSAKYRMETPIQSLCQSASAFDYKHVNIFEMEWSLEMEFVPKNHLLADGLIICVWLCK